MADPEKKAVECLKQADKKLYSAGGFFGSFFGNSSKNEEAVELYVKAGNNFKMAKKWAAAAEAFCKASKQHLRLDSKHEAASNYVEAGNCYRKADASEAIACLMKAIEIYTDMGRFSIAAKHHVTIAEIYENDCVDVKQAISHYEQAADYYKGEESVSSANKNLLKVAQFAAQLEDYDKAISIYEEIGMASMESQLLRYGAKEHFFRATLCRMCVDVQDAATSLNKYCQLFPAFAESRECKLVQNLLTNCEEDDVDALTETLKQYDSISRLDAWHTMLLLRVKKVLADEPQLT